MTFQTLPGATGHGIRRFAVSALALGVVFTGGAAFGEQAVEDFYKGKKIDMIIGREEMLTQAEITRYSAQWFPKYLYVCRVAPSEDKTSSAGDPWQGIVKEVKKQLAKASTQRLQERLHRQT